MQLLIIFIFVIGLILLYGACLKDSPFKTPEAWGQIVAGFIGVCLLVWSIVFISLFLQGYMRSKGML